LSVMEPATEAAENRNELDRRNFSWRTVQSGFLRSRRRDTRRVTEGEPLFTDWHHPWLFFLATGIMLFSAMDAFMTLQLLDRGAIEINPVMAAVIVVARSGWARDHRVSEVSMGRRQFRFTS